MQMAIAGGWFTSEARNFTYTGHVQHGFDGMCLVSLVTDTRAHDFGWLDFVAQNADETGEIAELYRVLNLMKMIIEELIEDVWTA